MQGVRPLHAGDDIPHADGEGPPTDAGPMPGREVLRAAVATSLQEVQYKAIAGQRVRPSGGCFIVILHYYNIALLNYYMIA
jgi:hypothetical protein